MAGTKEGGSKRMKYGATLETKRETGTRNREKKPGNNREFQILPVGE